SRARERTGAPSGSARRPRDGRRDAVRPRRSTPGARRSRGARRAAGPPRFPRGRGRSRDRRARAASGIPPPTPRIAPPLSDPVRSAVMTGYVPRVVRCLRRSMRRLAPPALAALLPSLSALGGETASALPPDDVLESRGARIGTIEIEAKDIF